MLGAVWFLDLMTLFACCPLNPILLPPLLTQAISPHETKWPFKAIASDMPFHCSRPWLLEKVCLSCPLSPLLPCVGFVPSLCRMNAQEWALHPVLCPSHCPAPSAETEEARNTCLTKDWFWVTCLLNRWADFLLAGTGFVFAGETTVSVCAGNWKTTYPRKSGKNPQLDRGTQ